MIGGMYGWNPAAAAPGPTPGNSTNRGEYDFSLDYGINNNDGDRFGSTYWGQTIEDIWQSWSDNCIKHSVQYNSGQGQTLHSVFNFSSDCVILHCAAVRNNEPPDVTQVDAVDIRWFVNSENRIVFRLSGGVTPRGSNDQFKRFYKDSGHDNAGYMMNACGVTEDLPMQPYPFFARGGFNCQAYHQVPNWGCKTFTLGYYVRKPTATMKSGNAEGESFGGGKLWRIPRAALQWIKRK